MSSLPRPPPTTHPHPTRTHLVQVCLGLLGLLQAQTLAHVAQHQRHERALVAVRLRERLERKRRKKEAGQRWNEKSELIEVKAAIETE